MKKVEKIVKKTASAVAVAGLLSASGLAAPSVAEVESVSANLDLVRGSASESLTVESNVLNRVIGTIDTTLQQRHSQTHGMTHSMSHNQSFFEL